MVLNPPQKNEIEISIFGPGYGESIAIHIGNNKWIIVDSCIGNKKIPIPAVLEYFQKIQVDTCNIVQIIATHWHDDHIRGLSEIIKMSPNAEFVCSQALRTKDFVTLTRLSKNDLLIKDKGISEFEKILNFLQEHKKEPKFAIADKCLFRQNSNPSIEIYALSPTDKMVLHSHNEIAQLVPTPNSPRKRVPDLTPNHTAVVLLFIIDKEVILLGSDLQNEKNCWVDIANSSGRPKNKAKVYKVAHHGSANACNNEIWDNLLEKEPYSFLTPFSNGNIKLPSDDDIIRLKSKTKSLYITSKPANKQLNREGIIAKEIKKAAKNIQQIQYCEGQIRARFSPKKNWEISCFGKALKL